MPQTRSQRRRGAESPTETKKKVLWMNKHRESEGQPRVFVGRITVDNKVLSNEPAEAHKQTSTKAVRQGVAIEFSMVFLG